MGFSTGMSKPHDHIHLVQEILEVVDKNQIDAMLIKSRLGIFEQGLALQGATIAYQKLASIATERVDQDPQNNALKGIMQRKIAIEANIQAHDATIGRWLILQNYMVDLCIAPASLEIQII